MSRRSSNYGRNYHALQLLLHPLHYKVYYTKLICQYSQWGHNLLRNCGIFSCIRYFDCFWFELFSLQKSPLYFLHNALRIFRYLNWYSEKKFLSRESFQWILSWMTFHQLLSAIFRYRRELIFQEMANWYQNGILVSEDIYICCSIILVKKF